MQFTVQDLVETQRKLGHIVGAIIDLTNTTRYYDSRQLESMGILYGKISCGGHEVPKEHLVSKFIGMVRDFHERTKETEALIAVHCTHGVNRTGLRQFSSFAEDASF